MCLHRPNIFLSKYSHMTKAIPTTPKTDNPFPKTFKSLAPHKSHQEMVFLFSELLLHRKTNSGPTLSPVRRQPRGYDLNSEHTQHTRTKVVCNHCFILVVRWPIHCHCLLVLFLVLNAFHRTLRCGLVAYLVGRDARYWPMHQCFTDLWFWYRSDINVGRYF